MKKPYQSFLIANIDKISFLNLDSIIWLCNQATSSPNRLQLTSTFRHQRSLGQGGRSLFTTISKHFFLFIKIIFIDFVILKQIYLPKIILILYRQVTACQPKNPSFTYIFQNKAHHCHNLSAARNTIKDRLDSYIGQIIDHDSKQTYNGELPANKRYKISVENQHMHYRLASIQVTPRKEAYVNRNYSRYNNFERKFRSRYKAKGEQYRLIRIKNQKIQERIASVRPQIGSHSIWESDYKQTNYNGERNQTFKRGTGS